MRPGFRQLPGAEVALVRDRLTLLADQGVYETVWLRPSLAVRQDSAGGVDSTAIRFATVASPAAERAASVGVSYDGHEGGRAWFAATNLSPAGGRVRVVTALSLGEWRQRLLITVTGLRRHPLPRGAADSSALSGAQVPLPDPRTEAPPWSTLASNLPRPELSLTASHEIVRLYDSRGRQHDAPSSQDLLLFAGFGRTFGAGQRLVLGTAAHFWSMRGAQAPNAASRSLGAMFRAVHTHAAAPGGPDPNRTPILAAEAVWSGRYHRLGAEADLDLKIGRLLLRPRGAGGWSDGLPLGAQFALGGLRGFPGLRIGERRGDRHAFGSLTVLSRLAGGPLFVRAEAGGGRTTLVSPLHVGIMNGTGQGWVRGAELGLVADTPIGPFSVAYGIASTERPVVKIRLGY
jgi:hypothetical protein